jgi:hypothetical protein
MNIYMDTQCCSLGENVTEKVKTSPKQERVGGDEACECQENEVQDAFCFVSDAQDILAHEPACNPTLDRVLRDTLNTQFVSDLFNKTLYCSRLACVFA